MVLSGDFTENSEDYGVCRFKRGFNVQIEELIGDFYKPIHKSEILVVHNVDKLRKIKEIDVNDVRAYSY